MEWNMFLHTKKKVINFVFEGRVWFGEEQLWWVDNKRRNAYRTVCGSVRHDLVSTNK